MIRAFLSLALMDGLRLSRHRANLALFITVPLLIVGGSAVLTHLFSNTDDVVVEAEHREQATDKARVYRIAVPESLRASIDASKWFVVTESSEGGFTTVPDGADFGLSRERDVLTLFASEPPPELEEQRRVERKLERALQHAYRSEWKRRGPARHPQLVSWNIETAAPDPSLPAPPNWIFAFVLAVIMMSQSLASTLFTQTRVERTRDTLSLTPMLEYFTLLSKFFWVLAPSLSAGFLTAALYMYPPLGLTQQVESLPPMYGAIPLGVTICFCMMALHARATNLRASSAFSILVTLPLIFLVIPGVIQSELPAPIWMFPITSATHLAHSVHLGSPPIEHLHPLLISWMWIAMLVFSTRIAWRHQPSATDEPTWEIFSKASVVVLLGAWLLGQPLLLLSPIGGLVLYEVFLLGALACAIPWWAGQPWRETMGFRTPNAQALLIALLFGLSSPALTVWVHEIQQVLSLAPSVRPTGDTWEHLSPLTAVLLLAIIPGICEELMFRGSLLGLLRYPRVGETKAVLATALVFAILHLDPARMLPTMTLGICLGVLAYRTRCVWVAVLAHAIHNTVIVLGGGEWFVQADLTAPVACAAIGLTWLTRSAR